MLSPRSEEQEFTILSGSINISDSLGLAIRFLHHLMIGDVVAEKAPFVINRMGDFSLASINIFTQHLSKMALLSVDLGQAEDPEDEPFMARAITFNLRNSQLPHSRDVIEQVSVSMMRWPRLKDYQNWRVVSFAIRNLNTPNNEGTWPDFYVTDDSKNGWRP